MAYRIMLLLTAALLFGAGCSDDDSPADPGGGVPEGQLADFSLLDVNSTSANFDQPVSPRDYLQKVSAWYFGHAT